MKMQPETIGDHVFLHIRDHFGGSQKAAAEAWGLSQSFVSGIIAGDKKPNGTILDALGMERRVRYVPKGWAEDGGIPE